jgi:uncharacterized Zn finger protein (UPF0148 family)
VIFCGPTVYCEATARGWIPEPGEIPLRLETPQVLQIYRMTYRRRLRVRFKSTQGNLRHSGTPIEGNLNEIGTIQRLVGERFREIIEPWTWRNADGEPIDPPGSRLVHYQNTEVCRKSRFTGTTVVTSAEVHLVSLCGLVCHKGRFKGTVTCPECQRLFQRNRWSSSSDDETAKETAKSETPRRRSAKPRGPLLTPMHVRSTEGSQHRDVDTLCGKHVGIRHTVGYSGAFRDQGPRITCPECLRFIEEETARSRQVQREKKIHLA